jgi:hypothetical protein
METIFSTLAGIIFGGLLGYFVSAHFYKKGILFEKHMYNVSHSIEEIYLNTKFPSIFVSQHSTITSYYNERPSDKDTPHLSKVCSETNNIKRGKELFILFHMIDEGMNLPLQSGVRVTNSLNGDNIPINFEGFGWCSCNVDIPMDAPIGSQKLFFDFEDSIGNRNKQEYIYHIII